MQSIKLSNAEDIANFAHAELSRAEFSKYLDRFGRVLYSSADSLSPGDIYLLGLNPAGESDDKQFSLENDLIHLPSRKENAYIDEAWNKGIGKPSYPAGEAPLQRRVKCVLENLGIAPSKVCASNLVFAGTNDATGINENLIPVCWKIHEKILEIVQPKYILCFGNSVFSPYGILKSKFYKDKLEDNIGANHGNWKVKGFETSINGRLVYIAGVPHLSRYDITTKHDVLEWLKDRFEQAKLKCG